MGRIKNGIFVLVLLALFAGMAVGQVKDSTVKLDKGIPLVGEKRQRVTNNQQVIYGTDTNAVGTVSYELVYDMNGVKQSAKEWYGIVDSASTAVDSLSRKIQALKNFVSSSRYLVIATCDSAWQYSSVTGFTAGRTFMLKAGESETFMILEPANLNIYYKKWSAFAGKALIRIKVYIL